MEKIEAELTIAIEREGREGEMEEGRRGEKEQYWYSHLATKFHFPLHMASVQGANTGLPALPTHC